MKIIGVTGSIAAGKTILSQSLAHNRRGAIFNADKAIHQLLETEAATKICELFPTVRNPKSEKLTVNRKKLGEIVFSDNDALGQLEKILHPMVKQKILAFIKKAYIQNHKFIILDIPLLFENKLDKYCDIIVLADVPNYVQKRRLEKIRKLDLEIQKSILSRQLSLQEKRKYIKKYSGIIVRMNQDIASVRRQVLHIKKELKI